MKKSLTVYCGILNLLKNSESIIQKPNRNHISIKFDDPLKYNITVYHILSYLKSNKKKASFEKFNYNHNIVCLNTFLIELLKSNHKYLILEIEIS